jgi:hypothetical protein
MEAFSDHGTFVELDQKVLRGIQNPVTSNGIFTTSLI